MPYTFHEQAVVLLGKVKITNEATGETTHYKAGDAFFVASANNTLWEVVSDSFTKHYLAVD
ncbi:cupin domain-containing protein [Ectopseudomonas alcaliphila]|uniref:cupin domain-containing protein n=1 Tax=Ectopseudomonas alcaliphila TaxID=101564 RepID=UPI0027D7F95A|nr:MULTISPECIES: cupin domain-containing protein [Pseudomonas]